MTIPIVIYVISIVLIIVCERMWGKIDTRKRLLYAAVPLGVFGVVVMILGRANTSPHDEKWLEKTYPMSIGDYQMQRDPGSDNPMQSYKMDETTYAELNPMGIVARRLSNGREQYDVVVISSHERDSFHNPLACFAAQEWKILDSHVAYVQTKSRGNVPFSVTRAQNARGQTAIAVYTYEGPTAMHSVNTDGFLGLDQKGLHGDLFLTELKTSKPQFATFFRFMSLSLDTPEGQILKFAGEYLDAAPVRPIQS